MTLISEYAEEVALADNDLFEIETAGGISKKVKFSTVKDAVIGGGGVVAYQEVQLDQTAIPEGTYDRPLFNVPVNSLVSNGDRIEAQMLLRENTIGTPAFHYLVTVSLLVNGSVEISLPLQYLSQTPLAGAGLLKFSADIVKISPTTAVLSLYADNFPKRGADNNNQVRIDIVNENHGVVTSSVISLGSAFTFNFRVEQVGNPTFIKHYEHMFSAAKATLL